MAVRRLTLPKWASWRWASPIAGCPGVHGAYSPEVEGAAQMLLECAIQFDVVDQCATFALPPVDPAGRCVLDKDWRKRLETYLAGGGRLVLSGTAALDPKSRFQLEEIPVTFVGRRPPPSRATCI